MNEAAKLLGISTTTLRRLEKNRVVKGYGVQVYYTPGGQRRYSTEEIEQYFKNRGFSGRFGFGERPVLIVMDCNTSFTSKESPMHGEWDKEVEHIRNLVDTAHQTKCPVIYSNSYFKEDDQALQIFIKKVPGMEALSTSPESIHLDPRIKAKKTDVYIYTKYFSVYSDSNLLEILQEERCDTLIISGFSTSGAVRAVATETIQHAIRPIIPAEAVGDRDELVHRNNLADIDRKFGDVMPIHEVIRYLHTRSASQ
ncbi:isochorismatase family protein [Alicyclobacillus fastidiosus]|uniref:Isochorismatase family protein n=1 Tax=Alicyclobacillus fastidiosus TaxID=392011 RepID=A0ABY6ZPD9_9BACL|nr:isochorismatase family protein [Alicyclobacillus fastidiosus]WAH44717.1 isochorismatase family protein [Alicyclobacillus fastidiosus]